MSSAFARAGSEDGDSPIPTKQAPLGLLGVEALSNRHEDEVLAFLDHRPSHTVFMAGLIRDNGLANYCNRGTFYAYRDVEKKIAGVALIGQKTLIEARTPTAFEALGTLVTSNDAAHLIRAEAEHLDLLLERHAGANRIPRLVRSELLMERSRLSEAQDCELRIASALDLESVVSINSALAFEENGVNPRDQDPSGIWERTARRISQGRVWVMIEQGRMIFKADVISETPKAVFLEGIYVVPELRHKGYGTRCLNQLSQKLLDRVSLLCLVVNEENHKARDFYTKAGFAFRSCYKTAYFSARQERTS